MNPEHQKVLEQLLVAFPPAPIQAEGAFADWGGTYPDGAAYMEHLQGKVWNDLERSYILKRHDALGFLGTRHLIAILPVYLRSLIEDGVWSASVDMVLLMLTKPGPEKKTGIKLPRFHAFADALTPAQSAAIAMVLRVFATMDADGSLGTAANDALERHWKAYLSAES